MKIRKYQRRSRNWKSARLTYAYHHPVSESVMPATVGVAYHVAVVSRTYCRQTSETPTRPTKMISSTSASIELRSRNAEAMASSNRLTALGGIKLRSRNCFTTKRIRW